MSQPTPDELASNNHIVYRPPSRLQTAATLVMAVVILGFCFWGFGKKFLEFIALCRGEVDGAFAITPVANYLLASLGFLCLFGWAAANGMFHDIERPKHVMLETEAWLDSNDDSPDDQTEVSI